MILFVTVAFVGGWRTKGIIDRKARPQQREKPEMMWFNNEKSQWERVTEMQLCVADRIVVTVPVKLVKEIERNNESR